MSIQKEEKLQRWQTKSLTGVADAERVEHCGAISTEKRNFRGGRTNLAKKNPTKKPPKKTNEGLQTWGENPDPTTRAIGHKGSRAYSNINS